MEAGIYFPIFFVLVDKNNEEKFSIYYLGSDLQNEEIFQKRNSKEKRLGRFFNRWKVYQKPSDKINLIPLISKRENKLKKNHLIVKV